MSPRFSSIAPLVISALLAIAPVFAVAADTGQLQASVRTAIMSDPRSGQLTRAQIDSMVSALSKQAESQGITPQDIQWRPQYAKPEQASQASYCDTTPFLCAMNNSFGFGGGPLIPLGLLVTSGMLMWLLPKLRHEHAAAAATPVPVSTL